MNKHTEQYLIQVINDYDLYPSEKNEIYRLQKARNLYWDDIDLQGAVFDLKDEEFARIKEIVSMAEDVGNLEWTTYKLTKDFDSSRYINKAKEVRAIWDDVTIELLEDLIEIDFDLLKERVENYRE